MEESKEYGNFTFKAKVLSDEIQEIALDYLEEGFSVTVPIQKINPKYAKLEEIYNFCLSEPSGTFINVWKYLKRAEVWVALVNLEALLRVYTVLPYDLNQSARDIIFNYVETDMMDNIMQDNNAGEILEKEFNHILNISRKVSEYVAPSSPRNSISTRSTGRSRRSSLSSEGSLEDFDLESRRSSGASLRYPYWMKARPNPPSDIFDLNVAPEYKGPNYAEMAQMLGYPPSDVYYSGQESPIEWLSAVERPLFEDQAPVTYVQNIQPQRSFYEPRQTLRRSSRVKQKRLPSARLSSPPLNRSNVEPFHKQFVGRHSANRK